MVKNKVNTMSYVADSRVNKLEDITIYDLNFIAKFHGAYKDDLRTGKFEFFHGNGIKVNPLS